jgi:hypothetical protein
VKYVFNPLKWFDKDDQKLEEIQEKTDKLLNKVEKSLPQISGQEVCDLLRKKPKNEWTQDDHDLWDLNGCPD